MKDLISKILKEESDWAWAENVDAYEDIINKLAEHHVVKRYHNYMSGEPLVMSLEGEGRVLSIVFETEPSKMVRMIEERIQQLSSDKSWRDFSNSSIVPRNLRR